MASRKDRRQKFGSVPIMLPAVGPFSDQTPVAVNSLSDGSFTGQSVITGVGTSRTNPFKYKTFTINSNAEIQSSTYSIWVWCDHLVFGVNSLFNVNGENGQSSDGNLSGARGGNGGSGGGGGGGAFDPIDGSIDGTGGGGNGSGSSGQDGVGGDGTEPGFPGAGGQGFGAIYNAGNPFTLPVGGNSIDNGGNPLFTPAGPYGASSNGANAFSPFGGNGGAAGGGAIIIVCNKLTGASGVALYANGGNESLDVFSVGAGGGGSIFVATKWKVNVNPAAYVEGGVSDFYQAGAGTKVLREINAAGTALGATHSNWSDTWNNS